MRSGAGVCQYACSSTFKFLYCIIVGRFANIFLYCMNISIASFSVTTGSLLTLICMGRGEICPPGSFSVTVHKRFALDCCNFVSFTISLLHIIGLRFGHHGPKLLPW